MVSREGAKDAEGYACRQRGPFLPALRWQDVAAGSPTPSRPSREPIPLSAIRYFGLRVDGYPVRSGRRSGEGRDILGAVWDKRRCPSLRRGDGTVGADMTGEVR